MRGGLIHHRKKEKRDDGIMKVSNPRIAFPKQQIDHCINSVLTEGNKNSTIPDLVNLGSFFKTSRHIVLLVSIWFLQIKMTR